jgi:hypothetical protein
MSWMIILLEGEGRYAFNIEGPARSMVKFKQQIRFGESDEQCGTSSITGQNSHLETCFDNVRRVL